MFLNNEMHAGLKRDISNRSSISSMIRVYDAAENIGREGDKIANTREADKFFSDQLTIYSNIRDYRNSARVALKMCDDKKAAEYYERLYRDESRLYDRFRDAKRKLKGEATKIKQIVPENESNVPISNSEASIIKRIVCASSALFVCAGIAGISFIAENPTYSNEERCFRILGVSVAASAIVYLFRKIGENVGEYTKSSIDLKDED